MPISSEHRKLSIWRNVVAALAAYTVAIQEATAQGIEHGMKMMAELQGEDSSGFNLMVVCIFLIMGCALTLITVTAMYTFKGREKKREQARATSQSAGSVPAGDQLEGS